MTNGRGGVAVFYSYSHADEALRMELETHLALLRRQGVIREWHDRKLLAGAEVDPEIDAQLSKADVILLLISPDFLASDYCYNREMTRALERHRMSDAAVIPIVLRPVEFGESPFAHLLALPTDAKPVTTWQNRDEAWLSVARGIRGVCLNRKAMVAGPFEEGIAGEAVDRSLQPEEADYGVLDFNAELESAMEVATECMTTMSSHAEELSAKLTVHTEHTTRLRASSFPNKAGAARQIATSMAAAIAAYASKLDGTAIELHGAWDRVERYFPRMMTADALAREAEHIPALRAEMSKAREILQSSRESALNAREAIGDLGQFSGALKLGTGRAQASLERIADEYWRMEQSLGQFLSFLDEAATKDRGLATGPAQHPAEAAGRRPELLRGDH